jgi:hypothetical protein
MSARTYCSQQNTDEPLTGTAARVDVWLLLEYRPVWKSHPHSDNALAPDVRQWLDQSLQHLTDGGYRPRLQFIRQPELDSNQTRLLIACDNRLLQFTGRGYGFLESIDVSEVVAQPHNYPSLQEPNYFVCTNGQRDLCCARFGLRTYAELRQLVGPRAWQITHLGGHRFAPNLLVLPDSALYGRVSESEVGDFVALIESGEPDFSHLRGRCRYPAHVQAAEIGAARPGLQLLHVAGDDSQAQVTFLAGEEKLQVRVQRSAQPIEVSKNCGEAPETVYPWLIIPDTREDQAPG